MVQFVHIGNTLFQSRAMEIIHEDLGEKDDTALPPFLAYSMKGEAKVNSFFNCIELETL